MKTNGKRNGLYKVGNMIFPSKLLYSTIASIDRNLRFLYSPAPYNSWRDTINYSPCRDDVEEFDAILDRVEERINRIKGKVDYTITGDADFNIMFQE